MTRSRSISGLLESFGLGWNRPSVQQQQRQSFAHAVCCAYSFMGAPMILTTVRRPCSRLLCRTI